VILDLGDGGKRDFNDLSVGDLNLYAWSREGLSGFHAANCAAYAPAVRGDYFHVVFAIQWLQGCERFCYLHVNFLPIKYASYWAGSLPNRRECNRKTVFGV
jgi:hypothetical protein